MSGRQPRETGLDGLDPAGRLSYEPSERTTHSEVWTTHGETSRARYGSSRRICHPAGGVLVVVVVVVVVVAVAVAEPWMGWDGWMGIPSHLICLGLIPETAGRAVRFQRAGTKLAERIEQLEKTIAMSFSHSSLAEA